MRIPKKTHELIRQNEQTVKKSQKHDANLQKNSTFYFQIGLIVCLLAAYGLLEMRFEKVIVNDPIEICGVIDDTEPYVTAFVPYEKPVVKVKPKSIEKKVVLTVDPKIIDDNTPDIELNDIITPDQKPSSDKPFNPNSINVETEPEDNVVVDFVRIESVPIYPGCENKKTNQERRQCMSEKLTKLIKRRFDANLGSDLGLYGVQKIQTQFTIDKTGRITDVKTRALHPKLEQEAKRIINSIPEMEPGKQRDKPVGVRYTLPIKFNASL